VKRDQAARLREIKKEVSRRKSKKDPARFFAITSGKGGVGKTNFALNLAISLSELNWRVLLIDADINLANLDILMGITPEYSIKDTINGEKSLSEIIIKGPKGISLLPASSGIADFIGMESSVRNRMITEFADLEKRYDIILIDTAAGIAENVIDFATNANEMIVLISPEPTSIMDAYALIKVSILKGKNVKINVVVNQIKSIKEGKEAINKIKLTVNRFLNADVSILGGVFFDKNVVNAVKNQNPFVLEYPESIASVCVRGIAKKITFSNHKETFSLQSDSFFDKILSTINETAAV